jgi:hypothetical protein
LYQKTGRLHWGKFPSGFPAAGNFAAILETASGHGLFFDLLVLRGKIRILYSTIFK